jgi:nitrogen fixation/metabolism regulation signal transduction histidine kinase
LTAANRQPDDMDAKLPVGRPPDVEVTLRHTLAMLQELEDAQRKAASEASSAAAARRHEELALGIVTARQIVASLKAAPSP